MPQQEYPAASLHLSEQLNSVGDVVGTAAGVCVGCRVPPVVVGETVEAVGDELGQISEPSIFVQK